MVIETVLVNLGAFRATIDYDAGEPSNWVHDIYSSGGKLHFRVDDNSATAKRSAVIHLAPEDKEPVEIRINQSGTEGAYIELNRPGTLASFIDFSKMDRYKSLRVRYFGCRLCNGNGRFDRYVALQAQDDHGRTRFRPGILFDLKPQSATQLYTGRPGQPGSVFRQLHFKRAAGYHRDIECLACYRRFVRLYFGQKYILPSPLYQCGLR